MDDAGAIPDPHQRDLWAPKPGPSYRNAFPAVKTTHLTVKLNIPEAWVMGSAPGIQLEIDMAACKAVREAIAQLRALLTDHVPPTYEPPAPAVQAPASAARAVGQTDYDECLSCQ